MNNFEIRKIELTAAEKEVRIFVDGRDLIELLKEFERTFADREGAPKIAGAYSGLSESAATKERFLGLADTDYGDSENKVAVLDCECGCEGCWPFAVKIEVAEDAVTWTQFEQPHRGAHSAQPQWDYEGFGPFVFDKNKYLHEIEKLGDRLS